MAHEPDGGSDEHLNGVSNEATTSDAGRIASVPTKGRRGTVPEYLDPDFDGLDAKANRALHQAVTPGLPV